MNAVRSCLLLLPLVLLGGCFDYTEEVHVHADGSGRFVNDFALLAELLTAEEIAEMRRGMEEDAARLRKDPDVLAVEVSDRADGAKHHFVFDLTARRYDALPRLVGAEGWLRFEPGEGKQVRYVRTLDESAGSAALLALGGRLAPDVGRADDVARTILGRVAARRGPTAPRAQTDEDEELDFHVTFKVHAPKVVKSNGEVDGGEASWRWRLEELDESAPPHLEADLDLASRSLLPLAIGAVGLGFAFLWLRKQWRRRAD